MEAKVCLIGGSANALITANVKPIAENERDGWGYATIHDQSLLVMKHPEFNFYDITAPSFKDCETYDELGLGAPHVKEVGND